MVKKVGMEPVPAWGPLIGGATLPYVFYGAGVFEGAVLSCTLFNHGGSLFHKYVF